MVKKSGRYHFNLMIKDNITSNKINNQQGAPDTFP